MAEESFYDKVYEIARLIPYGRVTSYGAIANVLGTKGTARMVGYAMGHCGGIHPPVPAHRVVNSQGMLTGRFHFPSPNLMQQMLENEGVEVENDRVKNFKKLLWDPAKEL
ncbi:MGMT family protein [Mucilaginibacter paludis]|uniref:Methylated-DNA-(Protein)-cysteine S-methyltransferase DNA binding n=1 Tax=Mucilaginibacter paludis DSM 18603 TaxID=714943 RepID=H1Y2F5_9SPHI|nr:MGMT family protein [Mucilaginibacter paludis]EHQ28003.1 Methylated-DNA-(protein)-cysteine S-methyltransferase DNA binding [Mucilaginibacter paludis DSM 18603]